MINDHIAQIEARLAAAENTQEQIDILNQLAWELRLNNLERAIETAERARGLATSGNFPDQPYLTGLANSLHILSRCQSVLGNYAQAVTLGLEALEIYEDINDLKGQGYAYNALGMIYLHMGNYPEALTTLLESLDVFEEIDDTEWQMGLLNNLGYLYLDINEPDQALAYLNQGLSMAKEHGFQKQQGDLLNNVCKAYFAKGDYDSALKNGLESIKCYRKVDADYGEAEALNSIGDIYLAQGEPQQALDCHFESLEISKKSGSKFDIVESLLRLGRVHRQIERHTASLAYFEQALSVAQQIEARHKIYECHKELAEVYKHKEMYKQALEHLEQYQIVERSVFSDRADNRLKSLQVMHQLEAARNEAEISQLRNVELQRQIEAREELIADLEAFSHMVAHDLRNPLASVMMSVTMVLELKNHLIDDDTLEYLTIARDMAERMGVIIRELLVLASVRQKDVTLVIVDMDELSKNALNILSYQIEQTQAEIILPDEWPQVFGYPAWIEEIWTNYISNALKYGGSPPRVELGYTREERGRVRFWVRDNGDGFSPDQQEKLFTTFSRLSRTDTKGYGLGLSIVQRIAEKLDGEVGAESDGAPGAGSTFYFTLPGMIDLEQ
jgi:signal transduction histidine kinase/predicted negative regulator of RcsB-dependent stress response